jgi:RNA polymerase sigma-70 factor (ECF subfamily)
MKSQGLSALSLLVSGWPTVMSRVFSAATGQAASHPDAANLRKAIRNFIQARVTDATGADDLTQDVLIKAENAAPSLSDPAKVQEWMFQIARNVVADYFRRSKRVTFSFRDDTPLSGPDFILLSHEQESRKAHLLRCVRVFVESLPDHYRIALVLVDFEGISQVELAKRLGLTVSAAKSRVQRARAKLRALIDACCEVDTDVYGGFIDCRRRGIWLPCE